MKKDLKKIIKDRLKHRLPILRCNLGLTQQELAEKSGLHVTAISHFETGSRMPSLPNLLKIAEALDCGITALISPPAKDIFNPNPSNKMRFQELF